VGPEHEAHDLWDRDRVLSHGVPDMSRPEQQREFARQPGPALVGMLEANDPALPAPPWTMT
jgi:hypothetical protein